MHTGQLSYCMATGTVRCVLLTCEKFILILYKSYNLAASKQIHNIPNNVLRTQSFKSNALFTTSQVKTISTIYSCDNLNNISAWTSDKVQVIKYGKIGEQGFMQTCMDIRLFY
jgi:hypothetical protein